MPDLMPSAAVRTLSYRLPVEILCHQLSVRTLRNWTRLMPSEAVKAQSYQLPGKVLGPQLSVWTLRITCRRHRQFVKVLISSAAWMSGLSGLDVISSLSRFYFISCLQVRIFCHELSVKTLGIWCFQQLVKCSARDWDGKDYLRIIPRVVLVEDPRLT